jgi:hypothetical protein
VLALVFARTSMHLLMAEHSQLALVVESKQFFEFHAGGTV